MISREIWLAARSTGENRASAEPMRGALAEARAPTRQRLLRYLVQSAMVGCDQPLLA
jgi:hypothetical protein